jgi:hypothetical protein
LRRAAESERKETCVAIQFKCLCGAECSADESMVGQLHHCAACGLDIPVVAEATGEASRDQPAATAEMIAQMLSATEGGRRGDRGPGLDELRGEVAAKEVEGISEEEAARRKAARDAFQSQLGKKAGADELIFQLTGKRPEMSAEAGEGAPAPGASARSPAAAIEMKKALRLAAPAKPIPTGKARAATHIRIKRVVYGPSLALGFICLALALYCIDALTLKLIPHKPTQYPELRTPNPQLVKGEAGQLWVLPQGGRAWLPIGEDSGGLVDGKMWAMPNGTAPVVHPDGKIWYVNDFGAEEPAEPADDMRKALDYDRYQREMSLWFGASLAITALVLLFLGFWTWNDVRIVRRDMGTTELPEAEPVSEDVAQPPSAVQDSQTRASGPPASPDAAATAPAGAPAPEGAPAPAAPGQEAASPAAAEAPAPASEATPSMPAAQAAPPASEARPPGEGQAKPADEPAPPRQA